MELILPPDPEALVIEYLRGVVALTGYLQGGTIATEVPATPPARYLTLTLLGGTPSETAPDWHGSARFQVDAWADTKAAANHLARLTIAALRRCANHATAAGVLSGANVVQASAWRPDTSRTPPSPRYSFTVDLYVHPTP